MKISKKLLSATLVICMVLTAVIVSPLNLQVKASGPLPATTHTFLDYGVMDGTYIGSKRATFKAGNILDMVNGGVLTETIEIGPGTNDKLYMVLFEGSAWEGIYVIFDLTNDRIAIQNAVNDSSLGRDLDGSVWYISPSSVGMKTFLSQALNMRFAFSPIDSEDLGISVYINGVQATEDAGACTAFSDGVYNAQYIYHLLSVDGTNKSIALYGNASGEFTLTSMRNLTTSDFGIADRTFVNGIDSAQGKVPNSIANTVFSTNINFGAKAGDYIIYGDAAGYGWAHGITVINRGSYLEFRFGYACNSMSRASGAMPGGWIIGTTLYMNGASPSNGVATNFYTDTFKLSISLAQVNSVDARCGIWINDQLFGNDFLILSNAFDGSHISEMLHFPLTGDNDLTVSAVGIDTHKNRKLTIDDFGITEGRAYTTRANQDAPATPLINATFTTKMTVTDTSGNPSGAEQFYMQFGQGTIGGWGSGPDRVWVYYDKAYINGYAFSAPQVGLESFAGTQFEITMSGTLVDIDDDGLKDDVRISTLINGKSIINNYIQDGIDKIGNHLVIYPDKASVTFEKPVNSISDYDRLSLSDFGIDEGEYFGSGSSTYGYLSDNSSWHANTSLDNKYFETNIRFNSYDSEIVYGCAPGATESNQKGIRIGYIRIGGFGLEPENAMTSAFGIMDATGDVPTFLPYCSQQRELKAWAAGTQLSNKTFTLGISTRVLDSDADGAANDLEIGVWINGKLINNSFAYYAGYARTLRPNIGLYFQSDRGGIALGTVTETEGVPVSYCLDDSYYIVDGDSVTIDGVSKGICGVISSQGTYDITYTDGSSTFKRALTAYYTSDATADGTVDIKDFVRLKKAVVGSTSLSAVGATAVGAASGVFPPNAFLNVRNTLLASHNTLGASQLPDSVIGATYNGTYINALGSTNEGTQIVTISDNGSSSYVSDKANFEGSGLDYVLDFNLSSDRDIRVLQITDTQIVDSSYRDTLGYPSEDLVETYARTPEKRAELLYDELDALVAEAQPDIIVMTGDQTFAMTDPDGLALQELADHLDSYKIPWAPVLGNHDQDLLNILTQGIVDIYSNAKYCLFNRRNEVCGNGNYSFAIAKNGDIQRAFFMIDSHGDLSPNSKDTELYNSGKMLGSKRYNITPEQIAWFRTVALKVKSVAGHDVSSSMCMHVPPAEVAVQIKNLGYSNNSIINFTGGVDDDRISGWKADSDTSSLSDFIAYYLRTVNIDSVFMGHNHRNAYRIQDNYGITYSYGLKTGKYYPDGATVTGGTLMTIDKSTSDISYENIVPTY